MRKKIKLRQRKLGRHQAHGMVTGWDSDNPLVEVDERLRKVDRLTIVLHECIHCAWPQMPERKVIAAAKLLAGVVWADNWRRIDQ